jgi:hypothetical protein
MAQTQYRLYTGEANEAQRQVHLITIEKGSHWKPILMSSAPTPNGVWISVIFENVIYAANEPKPSGTEGNLK